MSYGNSIINFGIIPEEVIQAILDEANRAHEKHGTNSMMHATDYEALAIISEELGESAKEINEARLGNHSVRSYYQKQRAELIQVAAMAITWIAKLDQKPGQWID